MTTNAEQESRLQSEWWTAAQAIAWIVEGTSQAVERAAAVKGMDGLQRLRLRPTSRWDGPPVSLAAAPAEMLRVARLGRLVIRGRHGVGSDLQAVPVRYEQMAFLDARLCFADEKNRRVGLLWVDLWARADECQRQWPGVPNAPVAPETKEKSVSPIGATATNSTHRTGRPPEYDWEGALTYLAGVAATLDGLPDVQARAADLLKEHFGKLNGGESPSDSLIRAKVSRVYQAWEAEKERLERAKPRRGNR
ncbi:hypothetical protein RSO01_84560 [Reyranella soli]|uniref:Uncharacterized protein n=1 Tax=Reyranella soli TaxID=1230389 RepID=A0A512NQR5_9HYPH|nr:hypothetical protein RSO01_84560 [Reyranella soli]